MLVIQCSKHTTHFLLANSSVWLQLEVWVPCSVLPSYRVATVCLNSTLQCCLLSYVPLTLTMSPPSSIGGPPIFVFWDLFLWGVADSASFLIFSKVCPSCLCLQRPSLTSGSLPSHLLNWLSWNYLSCYTKVFLHLLFLRLARLLAS